MPYDPFHQINFKLSPEESNIIKTPEMIRLKYIRQLGFTYLEFPSANHVRYDHCIGTLITADTMGRHLISLGFITDEDLHLLRLTSLIHDIGHGAFSHLAERIWNIMSSKIKRPYVDHEDITKGLVQGKISLDFESNILKDVKNGQSILREEIEKSPYTHNDILEILEKKKGCLSQIISGPIDVDRMDYLLRDCYYTGVPISFESLKNLNNLIQGFYVYEEDLVLYESEILWAVNLLLARDALYPHVYMHYIPRIANALFIRAFEMAYKNRKKKDIFRIVFGKTDDQLFNNLENSKNKNVKNIINNIRYGPFYYNLYGKGVLYGEINIKLRDEIEGACLAQKQLSGNVHANLREIEKKAEKVLNKKLSLDVDKSKIIVDIPKIPRFEEIDAKIFNPDREIKVKSIEECSPHAKTLALQHVNYWSIGIYYSPDLKNDISKIIQVSDNLFREGHLLEYL